jgi:hypothetical protein
MLEDSPCFAHLIAIGNKVHIVAAQWQFYP